MPRHYRQMSERASASSDTDNNSTSGRGGTNATNTNTTTSAIQQEAIRKAKAAQKRRDRRRLHKHLISYKLEFEQMQSELESLTEILSGKRGVRIMTDLSLYCVVSFMLYMHIQLHIQYTPSMHFTCTYIIHTIYIQYSVYIILIYTYVYNKHLCTTLYTHLYAIQYTLYIYTILDTITLHPLLYYI